MTTSGDKKITEYTIEEFGAYLDRNFGHLGEKIDEMNELLKSMVAELQKLNKKIR